MSPDKIQLVKDWPAPTTIKEAQSFLGLVNFNRQFIQDFSKTAIPPTELTRNEIPFNWTKKHDQAFDRLKTACIELPVLVSLRSGQSPPIRDRCFRFGHLNMRKTGTRWEMAHVGLPLKEVHQRRRELGCSRQRTTRNSSLT
jgi:hypothetical protein